MADGPAALHSRHRPRRLAIDEKYLVELLLRLLEVPSPTGYTDQIVRLTGEELERLGIAFDLTRRGAIRAVLAGASSPPDRALVTHLDTIGAMVRGLKPNGRLAVCPIGTWSSRFAEGARVTVFTDHGSRRGTLLPLLASGHTYGDAVDRQPVSWDQLELRVDDPVSDVEGLRKLHFQVGDYVAVDPQPEVSDSGFIVSRHLDDKAGVACLLAAAKAVVESGVTLPLDCHLLFTVFEEVGSGASAILQMDIAELVSIDNATPAPEQSSSELEVNIAMMDSAGPFDYHLTRKLIHLAEDHGIAIRRDVFRHYRSDAAAAIASGNDLRTALLCFGVDASHGWERTHIDGLASLARLLALYMQSGPTFERDRLEHPSLEGFPEQPVEVLEPETERLPPRQMVVEEVGERRQD